MQNPTEPLLSLVIPAYNEEKRLPKTLQRTVPYLQGEHVSFEVIVVDDGSTDATLAVVQELAGKYPEIRLVSDGANHGRGAAVKKGIFESRGSLILETDADGSVADEAIIRFVERFENDTELDVIFGSRELPESRIVLWQPPLRIFLGYGFLFLARALFWMWRTTDFTLGFKMYRRLAAHDVFKHQFDHYYVAEAEKVFVTKIRGHHFIELPVTWTDDPDSRIRPVRDVFRSLKGMTLILIRFVQGKYR